MNLTLCEMFVQVKYCDSFNKLKLKLALLNAYSSLAYLNKIKLYTLWFNHKYVEEQAKSRFAISGVLLTMYKH